VPAETVYSSSGPVPILDDAVTTNSIIVPDNQTISSLEVALRVDHPRVSDLVFHLIGPDGTRDLLVENRGGTTTNGMGVTLTTSNAVVQAQTFSGTAATSTNVIDTGQNSGTLSLNYNFFINPDELAVYYQGSNIFNSGLISGSGVFNIPYAGATSQLTIVMNPQGNSELGDAWTYSVDALGGAYEYLVLTEDTNKTTTPIKFAVPPFVPGAAGTNVTLSDFETAAVTNYTNGTTINDETAWSVLNNQVSVVNDPTTADAGNNFLALANGTISNTLPTVAGQAYVLTFHYRGPGIAGWWRGESNALDSSGNNNNGVLTGGVTYTNGEVDQAFN
jgi:hypothetical protein